MLLASKGKYNKPIQRLSQGGCFGCFWGFFSFVHGIFVFALTGLFIYGTTTGLVEVSNDRAFDMSDYNFTPVVTAFFVSLILQGIDFAWFYVIKREYKNSDANKMFMLPFGKAFVLHFTLLIFGFVFSIIGTGLGVLVYSASFLSESLQLTLSDVSKLIMGILTAVLLGLVKTWWDLRVLFKADKLGEYTTASQKKAAKMRRQRRLYEEEMK